MARPRTSTSRRTAIDWHERIDPEERFQRMYGLSAFFIGEQRVTDELGPIMRAAPTEDQRIFLSTQIADEARHVRFFDRFYSEVGVFEGGDGVADRLRPDRGAPQPGLQPAVRRAARRSASTASPPSPRTPSCLVEAITLYHMIIEGVLALTGQHFIIDYNEREGTLPGVRRGLHQGRPRRASPHRVRRPVPHRHGERGRRSYREAIQRTIAEALPVDREGARPAVGRRRGELGHLRRHARRRRTPSPRSACRAASR